jgi:hypothetical protein
MRNVVPIIFLTLQPWGLLEIAEALACTARFGHRRKALKKLFTTGSNDNIEEHGGFADGDFNWNTLSVSRNQQPQTQNDGSSSSSSTSKYDPQQQLDLKQYHPDELAGNVHIPSTGISVSDEMEAAQKDKFVTEVVPIAGLPGVAQLITSSIMKQSLEPARYLVPLYFSTETTASNDRDDETEATLSTNSSDVIEDHSVGQQQSATYVLVDVPPFSPQLITRMKAFMGPKSNLSAILVTSRDSIHYDEMPAMYSTRRADLDLWKAAFPDVSIVTNRLDTPRDCRAAVTQILDGFGPFAMVDNSAATFVETGRPLTRIEWVPDAVKVQTCSEQVAMDQEQLTKEDLQKYSPEAIRAREVNKSVLAVYTPGHTFGSMSFIFPNTKICCSGFTLPIEDTRANEQENNMDTGPALDCRGYITTSRGGIKRQMDSARALVYGYVDRFEVILPSRGNPLFLGGSVEGRKELLMNVIDQFEQIGLIYEQLGITSSNDDLEVGP